MAKLSFYGAVDGVTGSAYILKTRSATILLECGLVQGSRKAEEANRAAFPLEFQMGVSDISRLLTVPTQTQLGTLADTCKVRVQAGVGRRVKVDVIDLPRRERSAAASSKARMTGRALRVSS